jgi:predicted Zn finger-like uncharacterized protein
MRLICPNCDAQYEVDASMIPDQGRDLQCSNCGHTWFQPGAYAPPEADDDLTVEAQDFDAPDALADTLAGDPAESAPDAEPGNAPERADGGDAAGPAGMPAAAAMPADRAVIDEELLSVLREEAAREVEARRAEGTALETQPDLGLAAVALGAAPRPGPVDAQAEGPGERVALVRDAAQDDAGEPGGTRGPRRELLPDIEEINSTLSATRARNAGGEISADEPAPLRHSGFRRGFSLALLAMFIMLGLYVLAPSIAERVPATGPLLERYVGAVNGARVWLDDKMRSSTEALRAGEDQGG